MERRIVIIGLGLIGGSVALALRNAWPTAAITGIDRDAANLDEALRRGAIDAVGDPAAVRDADMVLLAVPVRQLPTVLAAIAPHLQAATVISDVGSTKQDVAAAARAALGERVRQFVPAHPIAGREHSGMAAAASELFEGRTVVLTPLAENRAADVNRVKAIWQACGARAVEMTAGAHDEIFAAVSHLPHMLAFALVDEFAPMRAACFPLPLPASAISRALPAPRRKCGAISPSIIVRRWSPKWTAICNMPAHCATPSPPATVPPSMR